VAVSTVRPASRWNSAPRLEPSHLTWWGAGPRGRSFTGSALLVPRVRVTGPSPSAESRHKRPATRPPAPRPALGAPSRYSAHHHRLLAVLRCRAGEQLGAPRDQGGWPTGRAGQVDGHLVAITRRHHQTRSASSSASSHRGTSSTAQPWRSTVGHQPLRVDRVSGPARKVRPAAQSGSRTSGLARPPAAPLRRTASGPERSSRKGRPLEVALGECPDRAGRADQHPFCRPVSTGISWAPEGTRARRHLDLAADLGSSPARMRSRCSCAAAAPQQLHELAGATSRSSPRSPAPVECLGQTADRTAGLVSVVMGQALRTKRARTAGTWWRAERSEFAGSRARRR